MGTYDTIGGTPRHDPAADVDNTTELQELVLSLLEGAGVPTPINDEIIELIYRWERSLPDDATPRPTVEAEAPAPGEMVLVPREATEEMLIAADGATDLIMPDAFADRSPFRRLQEFRDAYRVMIAARPLSPAPGSEKDRP